MPPKSHKRKIVKKGKTVTRTSEYEFHVLNLSESFQNDKDFKDLKSSILTFIRESIPKHHSEIVTLNVITKSGTEGQVAFVGIHY